MPEAQERYKLDYITNYLIHHTLLTGEKPTTLRLSADCYAWYVQEVNRMADLLGLQLGFRDGMPTYQGIPVEKIEKKPKLIT